MSMAMGIKASIKPIARTIGALCLGIALCSMNAGLAEAKAVSKTEKASPSDDLGAMMGPDAEVVADKDLSKQRGGFYNAAGALVRFGVDITRTVNGEVTHHVHAVFDGPVQVAVAKPATTPTTIGATISAGVTAVASLGNGSGAPVTTPSMPTPQDIAALTEALHGGPPVVNSLSNVVIQQTTSVTVDIANYANIAQQVSQIQLGGTMIELVRAQLMNTLAKF